MNKMFEVRKGRQSNSHIMELLGLTVGFDACEWLTEGEALLLCKDGAVMACLEGATLEAFQVDHYVLGNHLLPYTPVTR